MSALHDDHKAIVLRYGPVGLWRTSAGTADVLGASDVLFRPDGTGLVTSRSALFGTEHIPFLWAMAEPGRLRVRYLPEPGEDVADPDGWGDMRLRFEAQRNDVGTLDVLAEDAPGVGFWFLPDPLRWVGPVGDARP